MFCTVPAIAEVAGTSRTAAGAGTVVSVQVGSKTIVEPFLRLGKALVAAQVHRDRHRDVVEQLPVVVGVGPPMDDVDRPWLELDVTWLILAAAGRSSAIVGRGVGLDAARQGTGSSIPATDVWFSCLMRSPTKGWKKFSKM